MRKEWQGFKGTKWQDEVDVREFIQNNYTPYDGDESFMAEPTQATEKLWGALQKLQKEERAKGGVLDMETEIVSSPFEQAKSQISAPLGKVFLISSVAVLRVS